MRSDLEIDYLHSNPPPRPDPETLNRDELLQLVQEKDAQLAELSDQFIDAQADSEYLQQTLENTRAQSRQDRSAYKQLEIENFQLHKSLALACFVAGGLPLAFAEWLYSPGFFISYLLIFICCFLAGYILWTILKIIRFFTPFDDLTKIHNLYILLIFLVPVFLLFLH